MIATVSSSSWSWLLVEFFFAILAGAGGLIVWRGLWLEKKAAKEWHSNLDDFRRCKSKEKHGENLVIRGIIVEIIVVIGLALKSGLEMRRADPGNQPVSTMSAFASLEIGTNATQVSSFVTVSNAWQINRSGIVNKGSIAIMTFVREMTGFPVGGLALTMDGEECDVLPIEKETKRFLCRITFRNSSLNSAFGFDSNEPARKRIDGINGVVIYAPCLYEHTKIFSGNVTLVFNGSVIKEGSRLVKPMQTSYKANDDRAKLVFSPVAHFCAEIPALAAAVLSGYGSH